MGTLVSNSRHKRRLIQRALSLVLLTTPGPARGWSQSIEVGSAVQVSPSGTGNHWFTSLVAAPDDSLQLMACGIRQSPRQNSWQGFVYISQEGGKRWGVALIDSSSQHVSEETCAMGRGGRAYFIGQPWSRDFAADRSVLHLYRSSDHGDTWLGPVTDRWLDYARMAVDATDGPYGGRIYVIGNGGLPSDASQPKVGSKEVFLSEDGREIGPRVRMPAATAYRVDGNFPQHALVLPNGDVLAVYWIRLRRSDADTTESTLERGIEVVRTRDGGRSFDPPVLVARAKGVLDLVPSIGSYQTSRGSVVLLAWSDSSQGRQRVRLARSTDNGGSWSAPEVVDDAPASRSRDGGRGRDAEWGGLAVNRDGVIVVTWVEQDWACWRISASLDSGRTFLPSVPLNRCPRRPPSAAETYEDFLEAVPFIDTADGKGAAKEPGISVRYWDPASAGPPGLVADAAGAFHALWVLPHDQGRLWTTTIRVKRGPTPRTESGRKGLQDVTSRVAFGITGIHYDWAAGTLALSLTVLNRDSLMIRAPLILEAKAIKSSLGPIAPLNPDEWDDGHAVWDLSLTLESDRLRSHEETEPRWLTFSMERPPPVAGPGVKPGEMWPARGFSVALRVYGLVAP